MMPFILILYVFLPPIATFIFPDLKTWVISGHCFTSELFLLVLIGYIIKKQKSNRGDFVIFFLSILFLFFADIIYSLNIITTTGPFISDLGEGLYTGFMFFLFLFLIKRIIPFSFSKTSILLMTFTGIIHGFLNFKFILIPFYQHEPFPTLYNTINSTLYGVLGTFVLAVAIPYVIRATRSLDHLFLQSIIFLMASDFAIRYQTAFVNKGEYSYADAGWNLAISAIFALMFWFKDRNDLLKPNSKVAPYFSVRCLLTLAISGINFLFLFGILLVNLFTIKNAFNLTDALFLMFIIWFISNLLALKVSRDLLSIKSLMLDSKPTESNALPEMKLNTVNGHTYIFEADLFIESYNNLVRKINGLLDVMLEQAKKVYIGNLAAQVAHDIRSPLTALEMFTRDGRDLSSEEGRIIIRSSVGRIRDIANSLIIKHKEMNQNPSLTKQGVEEPKSVQILSSMLDILITEKRIQFRSRMGIEIEYDMSRSSYGLFAEIQPIEFKRVISNLINNAMEALGEKGKIKINISPGDKPGQVLLTFEDNGKGIPPDLLHRLGQRGTTFGKEGGMGLGLFHAFTSIEKWGGNLKIESNQGKGTKVLINIPQAKVPHWFVPVLKIARDSTVVILDDDSSIHQIWRGRFESQNLTPNLVHCSTPEDLIAWHKSHLSEITSSIVYLCDYELIGSAKTGLDAIEELGIAKKSILVTSRFEEPKILDLCEKLGVKLIPKGMAGMVSIEIEDFNIPKDSGTYDYVYIDDDNILRMAWERRAKRQNINLLTLKSTSDFKLHQNQIDKGNTSIYIDSNLGEGEMPGEDFSKILYQEGFQKLFISSGYGEEKFAHLPWLKYAGKECPF